MPSLKNFKRLLDKDLRHIKVILVQYRHRMPVNEWLRLVEATKKSILDNPEDFICRPLPSKQIFNEALEKMFEGFFEDQRLLTIQMPNVKERIPHYKKRGKK